jgi:PPK2 family polyphosphate:nucleotide phosphotransferase
MFSRRILDRFRVDPDEKFRLADHDPAWMKAKGAKSLSKDEITDQAKAVLAKNLEELADAQELLYADNRYSILVVLQAMDAAGKDSTIKHVMSGVNPQGCQVFSFKKPSEEELDHTFLWRCMCRLPERGRIGIFNRSYYEEVLIVKVHPELLDAQRLPPREQGKRFWKARYQDINSFERHLVRNGTIVLKFFLNVSKDEQKRRFLERLNKTEKNWKFSPIDVAERNYWPQYMQAFEDAIRATSTKWAPWYVVPADHKWITRALVAEILRQTICSLDLSPPTLPDTDQNVAEARRMLESE